MDARAPFVMGKFIFSILCYIVGMSSLCALFWLIELSWDSNPAPFSWSFAVRNLLVFMVFPLQHSILARPTVKDKIQKIIPSLLERPLYVGTSGLAMWFVLIYWIPFAPYLYRTEKTIPFDVLFYVALAMIVYSTTALNHATMFGLRQGYVAWKKKPMRETGLQEDGIYGIVRHPLTSLFIVALWSHETLTTGRLMFNILFTAYALIGTVFEERDLIRNFGESYRQYAGKVPAFLPRLGRG